MPPWAQPEQHELGGLVLGAAGGWALAGAAAVDEGPTRVGPVAADGMGPWALSPMHRGSHDVTCATIMEAPELLGTAVQIPDETVACIVDTFGLTEGARRRARGLLAQFLGLIPSAWSSPSSRSRYWPSTASGSPCSYWRCGAWPLRLPPG